MNQNKKSIQKTITNRSKLINTFQQVLLRGAESSHRRQAGAAGLLYMQLSGLFYHPIYGGYIHTVNRLLASQMRISWSVLLANKIGEEFTEQPSALASHGCTALKSVKLKRKSLKGQQCLSIKQQFQSYMQIIDKQIVF